jgi:uncharacterized protein YndB with AHSA1/START domain
LIVATVEVQRTMSAPPPAVYALISDVTRMAEWSPESAGAQWLTGRPGTVGATFRGDNRRTWTQWSTTCTVTAAEPGRRFAFAVESIGRPVSTWEYELEPHPDGCLVIERTTDLRPRLYKLFGFVTLGLGRRSSRNRYTMRQTLAALARAAEG